MYLDEFFCGDSEEVELKSGTFAKNSGSRLV
jgi:hypothetical protein